MRADRRLLEKRKGASENGEKDKRQRDGKINPHIDVCSVLMKFSLGTMNTQ